jgi:acetyltransferase-like isoleucine patch superfamily enzyme
MIRIDQKIKQAMQQNGISVLHATDVNWPDNIILESPCSLKWMNLAGPLHMKAFSYAVSGYFNYVKIGRYVSIGEAVQIGRSDHPLDWASLSPLFYQDYRAVTDIAIPMAAAVHPQDFMQGAPYPSPKWIEIGHDVWIGHGAFVMPGVKIGHGAVIAAGAIVTKDVPSYAVVAGVPAVIKKYRFSEKIIARNLSTEWWNYAFWDIKGAPLTDVERFLDFVDEKKKEGVVPYEGPTFSLADFVMQNSKG